MISANTMNRDFTAVIEKKGRRYIGTVAEVRGVNSQGRTLVELRRNIQEAVQLILESNCSVSLKAQSRRARSKS
jgi:predicted RNase H-like HicB family nuclease